MISPGFSLPPCGSRGPPAPVIRTTRISAVNIRDLWDNSELLCIFMLLSEHLFSDRTATDLSVILVMTDHHRLSETPVKAVVLQLMWMTYTHASNLNFQTHEHTKGHLT